MYIVQNIKPCHNIHNHIMALSTIMYIWNEKLWITLWSFCSLNHLISTVPLFTVNSGREFDVPLCAPYLPGSATELGRIYSIQHLKVTHNKTSAMQPIILIVKKKCLVCFIQFTVQYVLIMAMHFSHSKYNPIHFYISGLLIYFFDCFMVVYLLSIFYLLLLTMCIWKKRKGRKEKI